MDTETQINLLKDVSDFYDTSWNHLLIFVYIIGGIGGILLPLATWLYQKRLVALEEQRLLAEIDKKTNEFKKSAIDDLIEKNNQFISSTKTDFENQIKQIQANVDELKTALEAKIEATERLLTKKIAGAEAGVFHVQMTHDLKQENYITAHASACYAVDNYITSGDRLNLRRVCDVLKDNIFPKLNENNINHHDDCGSKDFEALMKRLQDISTRGDLDDLITGMKRARSSASKRKA